MAIQDILKNKLVNNYDVENDLSCSFGDTVKKDTNIVLSMAGETLTIPVTEDADQAIDVIRKYLCAQLPVGKPMSFSVFQRALFKITILSDAKENYAIIIFNDKKTIFEQALYVFWNEKLSEWVESDKKLQVFEKIMIAHGRQNIGSIQIQTGSPSLVNPRAIYAENTVQIPMSLRTNKEVRKVEIVLQEAYRIELDVKRIAMVPVGDGKEELHIHHRTFVISKNDNRPIRISKTEHEIPAEWTEAIKGELDFEMNPLNTAVHDLVDDMKPKYDGQNFYLTGSDRVWVKSENSWIPVHPDYLKHYLNLEDIKNEVTMYELLRDI